MSLVEQNPKKKERLSETIVLDWAHIQNGRAETSFLDLTVKAENREEAQIDVPLELFPEAKRSLEKNIP